MLYLRTGLPGASKTLNTVKEIVEEKLYTGTQVYYNNIKLLFLDLDVCYSFQGFFYGVYLPSLNEQKRRKYDLTIRKIHTSGELVSLDDVLHLKSRFHAYMQTSEPMDLFLHWCKKLYPEDKLKPLTDFYELSDDELTLDVLKGFKLHWERFDDPTDWHNLPNGSCIVIDECQEFFPQLSPSANRPEHYTKFATHRHKGVDIHLVTQNEKFIDSRVRNLAHRHIHYYNKFGGSRLFRVESSMVFDSASRHEVAAYPADLIKRDSKYYGVYWSADVHTHKLRIPKKLIIWGSISVIAVIALIFFAYKTYNSLLGDKKPDPSSASAVTFDSPTVIKSKGDKAVVLSPLMKSFNHPLAAVCQSLDYAGHNIYGRSRDYNVDHYFTCETGKEEKARELKLSDKGESEETEITYQEALFYSAKQLTAIGYKLEVTRDFVFLVYGENKIAFTM